MVMKRFIIATLLLSFSFSELIKPSDGDFLGYIHISFEWDQEPDAIEYNLQVSNTDSFDEILLNTNESSTVYIEKDVFDWDSIFYWRVRPIYTDGVNGDWINTSSFTIKEGILQNMIVDSYNEDLIED